MQADSYEAIMNKSDTQKSLNLERLKQRKLSNHNLNEYQWDESQNLYSMRDKLNESLTNLFDSLNRPLVHENRFDLT